MRKAKVDTSEEEKENVSVVSTAFDDHGCTSTGKIIIPF